MTKPDKTRQLSIEQQNAIDLLVIGKTDQEVAAAVRVSRQTICAWRLHHPNFQAELNKRRHAVWGVAADKLRNLLLKALDIIEGELESNLAGDTRLKLAFDLVKMAGLQPGSIGPQDPEEIVEIAARNREVAALMAIGNPDLSLVRQGLLTKAGEWQADDGNEAGH